MKRKQVDRYADSVMRKHIADYLSLGWADANAAPVAGSTARMQPAFLLIASSMRVVPKSEVQIMTRCQQTFRGTRLLVADESQRFDLTELKIDHRSQLKRAEHLPLRAYLKAEVAPDLIRWPLVVCGIFGEICVHAIIPASDERGADDPGEVFEMLLLGEVA